MIPYVKYNIKYIMMSSIDNNIIISPDAFIQDIQYILKDITYNQKIKCNEIHEHFKNIASNPTDTYSSREQIAILMEIMNCYNTNMQEYQQNMTELSAIMKTLIKSLEYNRPITNKHNIRRNARGRPVLFEDTEDIPDDTNTAGSPLSLYDYFMKLIWGENPTPCQSFSEPAVHFADIFQETETDIQYTRPIIRELPEDDSLVNTITPRSRMVANKKPPSRRRNTIQPIIKHIPHM